MYNSYMIIFRKTGFSKKKINIDTLRVPKLGI
jgi:hypothetical protein